MAPTITNAVAISLLALFIAVSIPAAIDTGTTDSHATYELNRSETVTVTQSLRATLDGATNTSATVTLRDTETSQSKTKTIPVDATENYSLNNDTVSVTVENASNSMKQATITVAYPRTYGWEDGTERVVDNLPLVFAALGAMVVIGLILGVIR